MHSEIPFSHPKMMEIKTRIGRESRDERAHEKEFLIIVQQCVCVRH